MNENYEHKKNQFQLTLGTIEGEKKIERVKQTLVTERESGSYSVIIDKHDWIRVYLNMITQWVKSNYRSAWCYCISEWNEWDDFDIDYDSVQCATKPSVIEKESIV